MLYKKNLINVKIITFTLFILITRFLHPVHSQNIDSVMIRDIFSYALTKSDCYGNLEFLCKNIGHRLSGSPGAEKAVKWTKELMESYAFDTVYLQPVMVPVWIRGKKESARIITENNYLEVKVMALGGTPGTGSQGIRGKIIEVHGLNNLDSLKEENIRGKIVFFNQPMDPTLINTFQAYGLSGRQRNRGPAMASSYGAIGAVVRSMTERIDDLPHTGATGFQEGDRKIPAVAISTAEAGILSQKWKENPDLEFYFETYCQNSDDVLSYNVIGEIRGSLHPEEIIMVGGHIDSWDVGEGAHDDGAGCVQSIEVLKTLKQLGYLPRRTLRVVMFMNEENGLRGGRKYAEIAGQRREKHIAALESDSGGFSPKGFGLSGTDEQVRKFKNWSAYFQPYRIYEFEAGGGGADIGPLRSQGVPLLGLRPDSHKYFNYHHAASDILEAVDKRELELGAAAMTALVYLIDQYGL